MKKLSKKKLKVFISLMIAATVVGIPVARGGMVTTIGENSGDNLTPEEIGDPRTIKVGRIFVSGYDIWNCEVKVEAEDDYTISVPADGEEIQFICDYSLYATGWCDEAVATLSVSGCSYTTQKTGDVKTGTFKDSRWCERGDSITWVLGGVYIDIFQGEEKHGHDEGGGICPVKNPTPKKFNSSIQIKIVGSEANSSTRNTDSTDKTIGPPTLSPILPLFAVSYTHLTLPTICSV